MRPSHHRPLFPTKHLLTLLALLAATLAPSARLLAAEQPKPAPVATSAPATPAPPKKNKPAATPVPATPAAAATPAAPRATGMYVKVDAIDAKAKSFTHTNKDGTVVKFIVTGRTEIKNGDAAAKFEDIKVGDTVSGSRIKKSATEYEVAKITKFIIVGSREKRDGTKKP